MTAPKRDVLERVVVGAMWTIMLGYIVWSSAQISANSRSLGILDERTQTILARIDKTETLRDALSTVEHECLGRNRILTAEIETLKRHVATDSVWSKRIDERLADLTERMSRIERGKR
jgi:hypothetical protein